MRRDDRILLGRGKKELRQGTDCGWRVKKEQKIRKIVGGIK